MDLEILPIMSCNSSRLRKTLEGKTEGMRLALPQEEKAEVDITVFKQIMGLYEKGGNKAFLMPTLHKTVGG